MYEQSGRSDRGIPLRDQQKESPRDAVAVEFGAYRIHELIGTGGMAEVYRATREETDGVDGPVVIKRVKPQHAGDPGFVSMFVDEARLSSQLQHSNIVSVYEYGEQDGHHFIAMEYIDGLHLQGLHVRYAQRYKRSMPWRVGLHIVRDVLRGLEYVHEKRDENGRPMGLIHRDINLVNIMVARSGAVKLLDFGIVKAVDGIRSAETVGGVLKGKFGYMSPEQAEGKLLDRRSDVFSASIVLHELLTGRRLFWGKDDLEILRRVRTGDVPDPRQFAPDVPEDLVTVVNKGLARDVAQRYQSAAAMADALDEVIERNHVLGSVLRDLMLDLLGEEQSEASVKMAERRRKMTLLAWKQGVREQEAPRRRSSVAGTLGGEDATAVGRKTAGAEPLRVEHDTVITTDIKWMSAGGAGALKPVISEQALAALEEAEEAELAEELADLEPEAPSEEADETDLAAAEQKTQILDDETDLAAAEQKTQILDDETDLAAAEQKTQILDDETDA
jgi:serine/threonine protein kinase